MRSERFATGQASGDGEAWFLARTRCRWGWTFTAQPGPGELSRSALETATLAAAPAAFPAAAVARSEARRYRHVRVSRWKCGCDGKTMRSRGKELVEQPEERLLFGGRRFAIILFASQGPCCCLAVR